MIIEANGLSADSPTVRWRKSSRSGPYSDNCVEVAFLGGGVAVRDSKDPSAGALVFSRTQWQAFVADTKRCGYDLTS